MVLRFLRFNVIGAVGIGVQLGMLALLVGVLHVHYLVATALAIEVSVLHNFFWHLRWTWAAGGNGRHDRVFFRCVAFHAGNGLVSMLGTLAIMPLLVGGLGLHYLLANLVAIACTGGVNFLVGERLIFRRQM
jgi:putative flippase GtrA